MRYGITRLVLGFRGFIELSQREYTMYKSARNALLQAFFIEEKFDLLVENYFEYEETLLTLAMRMIVFPSLDEQRVNRERRLVNRRVINLLTTARLYVDQVPRHLRQIYGDSSEHVRLVNKIKSEQYDKLLGYRAMEALRNYAQHRDIPIHSLIYSHKRNEQNVQHMLIPFVDLNYLEEDSTFKRSILEELRGLSDRSGRIDVRPFIREYLDGLQIVHREVRRILKDDIAKWEFSINDAFIRFRKAFLSEVTFIHLVQEQDGKRVESVSIFKEIIERRRKLEAKNPIPYPGFRCGYVTNQSNNV